jgi:hypothetical protein
MCWSGEASFTLATLGFIGAAYAIYRKEPVNRWLPLMYFSGMETLQGFTYSWIGQCGNTYNHWLTVLSYLHIVFQPFFATMFALSFISHRERKEARWIWIACSISALIMLCMYLFPNFPGNCVPSNQSLCGTNVCSYHGNWHIAWILNLSNLDPHYISYWITVFVLPMFYKSWRFALYHLLFGPLLSAMLTNDPNEQPAIWCLLSISFLMATHVPVINKLLLSKEAKAEHKV